VFILESGVVTNSKGARTSRHVPRGLESVYTPQGWKIDNNRHGLMSAGGQGVLDCGHGLMLDFKTQLSAGGE
jgi:hypothetical protein